MRTLILSLFIVVLLLSGCTSQQEQKTQEQTTQQDQKTAGEQITTGKQITPTYQVSGERTLRLYLNDYFLLNNHKYTFCEYGAYTQEYQKKTVFFCQDDNRTKGATIAVGVNSTIDGQTIFIQTLYAADLPSGETRQDSYIDIKLS